MLLGKNQVWYVKKFAVVVRILRIGELAPLGLEIFDALA